MNPTEAGDGMQTNLTHKHHVVLWNSPRDSYPRANSQTSVETSLVWSLHEAVFTGILCTL